MSSGDAAGVRRSPTDVGPLVRLPTIQLLAGVLAGAGVAAVLGYVAVSWLRPSALGSVSVGAGAGVVALAVMVLGLRPWRARLLGRWPFALLSGSIASLAGALALMVSLYSATPADPVVLGLAMAGAWFAGFMGLVGVYGRFVRSIRPESPV